MPDDAMFRCCRATPMFASCIVDAASFLPRQLLLFSASVAATLRDMPCRYAIKEKSALYAMPRYAIATRRLQEPCYAIYAAVAAEIRLYRDAVTY